MKSIAIFTNVAGGSTRVKGMALYSQVPFLEMCCKWAMEFTLEMRDFEGVYYCCYQLHCKIEKLKIVLMKHLTTYHMPLICMASIDLRLETTFAL